MTCKQTEEFLCKLIMNNCNSDYIQSGKPTCPDIFDNNLLIGFYQFKIGDAFYAAKVSFSNYAPSLTMREVSWKKLTQEELKNKTCKLF